jgi:hypothetical protein
MIPRLPQIEASLAGLDLVEVDRAQADQQTVLVSQPIAKLTADDRRVWDPTEIVLRQGSGASIPLPRLIDRIADEMKNSDHAHMSSASEHRIPLARGGFKTVVRPSG